VNIGGGATGRSPQHPAGHEESSNVL
jgi:hypothetical protein